MNTTFEENNTVSEILENWKDIVSKTTDSTYRTLYDQQFISSSNNISSHTISSIDLTSGGSTPFSIPLKEDYVPPELYTFSPPIDHIHIDPKEVSELSMHWMNYINDINDPSPPPLKGKPIKMDFNKFLKKEMKSKLRMQQKVEDMINAF